MKNLLIRCMALLLILMMVLPLVACGAATTKEKQSMTESEQPSPTDVPHSEKEETSENSTPTPTPTPTPEPTPTKKPTPTEPKIPVEQVTLNQKELLLTVGDQADLEVTVLPANASRKEVTWEMGDTSIADVFEGKITAKKAGETIVTVKSVYGNVTDFCRIVVKNKALPMEKIDLKETFMDLTVGGSGRIVYSILPADATERDVFFKTSNPQVASVSEDGQVKGLKEGKAVITVSNEKGTVKAELQVEVTLPVISVSGVSFDKENYEYEVGDSCVIKIKILPENADNQKYILTSSAPQVVFIDEKGQIILKGAGKATLTVKTVDQGKTDTCTVTVHPKKDPIEKLDLTSSKPITDFSGFNGLLRLKSTGEIVFSPYLKDFLKAYPNPNSFSAYLRFTVLPKNEGDIERTYPSVKIPVVKSSHGWCDFFLQKKDYDCGFCPTAGYTYHIEIVIVDQQTETPRFHGTFRSIHANEQIAGSKYYNPTPIGGNAEGEYILQFEAGLNGSISGELKQVVGNGKVSSVVVAVPDTGYVFVMWSDGVTNPQRGGESFKSNTKLMAYFAKESTGEYMTPDIYIETESKTPVTTKNYGRATVTVIGTANKQFDVSTIPAQIRGRGNSSWNGGAPQTAYDSKNSYRLKFDEKIQFLGIGSSMNRDWILQANKFDLSGLRNVLIWNLAEKMGNIPYVPECTWVNLYVNGAYRGMYMVTEQIEVAKDRVEVDDSINSSDKGYLIELDFRGNSDTKPYFYIDGYLSGNVEFVIKSQATNADIPFIQDYVQKSHNAIMSGSRTEMEKYVDMKSFVDMYILEELSKDVDVGRASFFICKNAGGKLFFTAPWDFDFGFGTYGPANRTEGFVSQGEGTCPWYASLLERKWFRDEVVKRMEELSNVDGDEKEGRGAFEQMLAELRETGKKLQPAADKNAIFWNLYGKKFHQYVSHQVSSELHSYEEHINFLVDWTMLRWENLYFDLREY